MPNNTDIPNCFVVGLIYNQERVLLIRKNRPEWQAGKLNGVGGHVRRREDPAAAMTREFYEEAGIHIPREYWNLRVILVNVSVVVRFYIHKWVGSLDSFKSRTDEELRIVPIEYLYDYKVIPNLRWIIPLSLDKQIQGPIMIHDISYWE